MSAFVVAIVGAESTGKSTLAQELGATLAGRAMRVAVVAEALRDFCATERRTPRADEQAAIAAEQSARIDAARASADVVVADTSALMIAVYSELVFGDTSLYADALLRQRRYDLTLLTGLDLPWQADGLQRDGAHVREPVDALLRAALARAAIAFTTVAGHGAARLAAALHAIDSALASRPAQAP